MKQTTKQQISIFCIFLVCTLMLFVPSANAATNIQKPDLDTACDGFNSWGLFGTDYSHVDKSALSNKDPIPIADYTKAEWCDFSYRKRSVGFSTVWGQDRYHPDRYQDGKDWTACFGQNDWLTDLFTNPANEPEGRPDTAYELTLNPRTKWLTAFQCLCLIGIRDRLDLLRGIVSAIMACLISVRTTSFADSTLCKELFTTYVCDLIWELIQFISRGCIGWGESTTGASSGGIVEAFSTTLGAASDAVTSIGKDVASDYGDVLASGLFGTAGDNLARAICLWFFGFDFPITFETILDATYNQPGMTLVTCDLVKSREYLYSIPGTDTNSIEYDIGCFIRAGCPIANARIDLACATMEDENIHEGVDCSGPDPTGVSAGNKCDCYSVEPGTLTPRANYHYIGQIGNREPIQPAPGPKVINRPYRYDHAVVKLTLDKSGRQVGGATGLLGVSKSYTEEDCFPPGHRDGEWWFPLRDKTKVTLGACTASPTTGKFFCSAMADLGLNGTAYIESIKINEYSVAPGGYGPTLFDGQTLRFVPTIFKDGDQDLCLIAELYDNNNQPVQVDVGAGRATQAYVTVKGQGTHQYPITLKRNMGSGRVSSQPVHQGLRPGMNVVYGNEVANVPSGVGEVSLTVEFFDPDKDGLIDFNILKGNEEIKIGNKQVKVSGCNSLESPTFCLIKNEGLRIRDPAGSGFEFTIKSIDMVEVKTTASTSSRENLTSARITFKSGTGATSTQGVETWRVRYKLTKLYPGKISCAQGGFDDTPTGIMYSTAGQPQSFETPVFLRPRAAVGDAVTEGVGNCDVNGYQASTTKCLCGNKGTCEANTYCIPDLTTFCSLIPKCPTLNNGRTYDGGMDIISKNEICICGGTQCNNARTCYKINGEEKCTGIPACENGQHIWNNHESKIDCDCNLDGDRTEEDLKQYKDKSDGAARARAVCCGAGNVVLDNCPGQTPSCRTYKSDAEGIDFHNNGTCVDVSKVTAGCCGEKTKTQGTDCEAPKSICCELKNPPPDKCASPGAGSSAGAASGQHNGGTNPTNTGSTSDIAPDKTATVLTTSEGHPITFQETSNLFRLAYPDHAGEPNRPETAKGKMGAVWIPDQLKRGGSAPLIITLHGWRGSSHPAYNIFLDDELGHKVFHLIAQNLIDLGRSQPVIIAAPMDDPISDNEKDIHRTFWLPKDYNINTHVEKIKELFKQKKLNIQISSVSIVGHSNANCGASKGAGLRNAVKQYPNLYLVGMLDGTCSSLNYAKLITKASDKPIYVLFENGEHAGDVSSRAYMRKESTRITNTHFAQNYYSANKNDNKQWYSYNTNAFEYCQKKAGEKHGHCDISEVENAGVPTKNPVPTAHSIVPSLALLEILTTFFKPGVDTTKPKSPTESYYNDETTPSA